MNGFKIMENYCPICDAPIEGADYCKNCGLEIEDNVDSVEPVTAEFSNENNLHSKS